MKSDDLKVKANAFMVQGRFSEAVPVLMKLYKFNSSDDDILLRLGVSEIKLGHLEEAQNWLLKACDLKPTNPACYLYLANIQTQNHQAEEAIESYRAAISLQPDLAIAHLNIASLLMELKQLDDAEYHYKYVIKLQPGNADAYANLAQVEELLNKIEEARDSVAKALKIVPNHLAALMALGKIEKREKNYSVAEGLFRKIKTLSSIPSLTAIASFELGHCLDKLGQYDNAYAATLDGKGILIESIKNLPFDKSLYQKKIKQNRDLFDKSDSLSSDMTDNERRAPIFFVGFPRSGTTLVEQILNEHTDLVTSDEFPLIDNLIEKIPTIIDTQKPYPACLDEFTPSDYALLRESYWLDASNMIGDLDEHKILVDKLPLNIVELGFISRLFPNSHILVALRDPRDVCLSGFMQSFTLNPAMINFTSMESTVDFYNEVMGLWKHYKQVLPINWHEYKYEDIVDDFDATTRGIFEFFGLDYPEKAEYFYESAKNRMIDTPSYQDVATPVYARSKERWRNYKEYFTPYMDKLEPFITGFGY